MAIHSAHYRYGGQAAPGRRFATGRNIVLELLVPRGGIKSEKPITESGQIPEREFLDGALNFGNGTHNGRIIRVDFRSKRRKP